MRLPSTKNQAWTRYAVLPYAICLCERSPRFLLFSSDLVYVSLSCSACPGVFTVQHYSNRVPGRVWTKHAPSTERRWSQHQRGGTCHHRLPVLWSQDLAFYGWSRRYATAANSLCVPASSSKDLSCFASAALHSQSLLCLLVAQCFTMASLTRCTMAREMLC